MSSIFMLTRNLTNTFLPQIPLHMSPQHCQDEMHNSDIEPSDCRAVCCCALGASKSILRFPIRKHSLWRWTQRHTACMSAQSGTLGNSRHLLPVILWLSSCVCPPTSVHCIVSAQHASLSCLKVSKTFFFLMQEWAPKADTFNFDTESTKGKA